MIVLRTRCVRKYAPSLFLPAYGPDLRVSRGVQDGFGEGEAIEVERGVATRSRGWCAFGWCGAGLGRLVGQDECVGVDGEQSRERLVHDDGLHLAVVADVDLAEEALVEQSPVFVADSGVERVAVFDKPECIVEALAEFGDGAFGGCHLLFGVRLGCGESGHLAFEEVEWYCSGVMGLEQGGAFAIDFVQGGCGSACAFDGVGLLGVDLGPNDLANGVDLLVRNTQGLVEVDDRVLDGCDADVWPGTAIGGSFGAHAEEVVVAFPCFAGIPGEHHAAATPPAGD